MTAALSGHPPIANRSATAGNAAPVIELTGITRRFPGVVANDDISLAFHAGEVHVLLGENGAGKSTLIGILSGVIQPDQGTIAVQGRQVAIASPRAAIDLGIGTVYQHTTLVPTLTVAENLMLGQSWRGSMNRHGALARLAELSAMLGVQVDPDAHAGELALGQQQQIEIIKALWRGQRVLILDEPTSMLTPQGVKELGAVILRLRAAGMAIIFITHKLHEVLEFGDRVSILKLGRLVGQIDPPRFRTMSAQQAGDLIIETMFGRQIGASDEAAEFAGATDLRRATPFAPDLAPVLALEGVATQEQHRDIALAEISFTVRPGEIFGVAGVDGNGQKQLAEVIAGQRAAESGTIHFARQNVTHLSVRARQHLGLRYLTDDRIGEGTIGGFSVALNLVMKRVGERPFWRRGAIRPEEIDRNAQTLIAEFDVRTPGPQAPIATLSGGNIQKALFGRELAMEPRLVVYNKPTYGLDVANIRASRLRIRAHADRGVASVLISTELEELTELCDRVGVMYRGRMVGIVDNGPGAAARIGHLMVTGGLQ